MCSCVTISALIDCGGMPALERRRASARGAYPASISTRVPSLSSRMALPLLPLPSVQALTARSRLEVPAPRPRVRERTSRVLSERHAAPRHHALGALEELLQRALAERRR